MTVSPWPDQRDTPTSREAELLATVETLAMENEGLAEAYVDAELQAEDKGWVRLGAENARSFSRPGLSAIVRNTRLMSVLSPLIKRGLMLRNIYVWGQGVEIAARDKDVDAVVQTFLDDASNQGSFTTAQAREELERALGTDGNVFLAAFTSPLTGRVQVRSTPFEEVTDIVKNPEDRDEPWFYKREWETTVIEPGYATATTRTRRTTQRALHPALGFFPPRRPQVIDGIPVRWDAPMLAVQVNRLDGTDWGVPDAYAAIAWARAYEGFMTDWARLMKSLSRFAWRLSSGRKGPAERAAAGLRASLPAPGATTGGDPAGGVVASTAATNLEAIPKSGATIDANSGKPLAGLVAAALGVPVTMLLADPGTTGARAVAETLDFPTVLEASNRRELWTHVHQKLIGYAILQAAKAPRGGLRGTVLRDETGQETLRLAGDVDATVEVNWPDLDQLDPKSLVEAIKAADDTGKMPGATTLRLLLAALRVRDVDAIMAQMLDEDGRFIDPEVSAAVEAIRRHRRGEESGLED